MRFLTPLLAAFLLVSCSLQAKLVLSDEAASVEASFALAPATRAAWANLRELDPTLPVDPFDPALLRRGLGSQAVVATTLVGTTLKFPVPQPRKLLPDLKADAGSWEVTLDRAALRRWASLTSWAGSPVLDSLLPAPKASVSEAEYRDLLVYLLGPGTPEAAARTLIDKSFFELTVVAPRAILSAEGSVSVDGRNAVYRWPLVRVLALEKPLRLRLTF
jgi:hypothetical protein